MRRPKLWGNLCEADVLEMCLECRWGVWEELYHAEEEIISFIPNQNPEPGWGVSMSCGTAGVTVQGRFQAELFLPCRRHAEDQLKCFRLEGAQMFPHADEWNHVGQVGDDAFFKHERGWQVTLPTCSMCWEAFRLHLNSETQRIRHIVVSPSASRRSWSSSCRRTPKPRLWGRGVIDFASQALNEAPGWCQSPKHVLAVSSAGNSFGCRDPGIRDWEAGGESGGESHVTVHHAPTCASGLGRACIISAAAAESRLVSKAPLPVSACRDNL